MIIKRKIYKTDLLAGKVEKGKRIKGAGDKSVSFSISVKSAKGIKIK